MNRTGFLQALKESDEAFLGVFFPGALPHPSAFFCSLPALLTFKFYFPSGF